MHVLESGMRLFYFQASRYPFQVIWGYGKGRQNWLHTDWCGAAEHQEPRRSELLLALAAPVFLRVSGKVFPLSSAQPLQSRRQGDFWGWDFWHILQSFSPAGWLFLVADAGLWLKGISSECIVCSRGLSSAICIMHNHPHLTYLIWVENNSGYEICKRDLWSQHFENKNAWWLFMLLFSFMQIGWW